MKPTAGLVHTSRGPIVDEATLIDAVKRRGIAGAVLDVFGRKPLAAGRPSVLWTTFSRYSQKYRRFDEDITIPMIVSSRRFSRQDRDVDLLRRRLRGIPKRGIQATELGGLIAVP